MSGELQIKNIGGIDFANEDLKRYSVTEDGKYKVELKSGQVFVFDKQSKTDIKMQPSIYSGPDGFKNCTNVVNCHNISIFGSNSSDRFSILESDVKTLKLSGDALYSADVVEYLINSTIEHKYIDDNDYVAPNKNMKFDGIY